jgi:hypothetical protein
MRMRKSQVENIRIEEEIITTILQKSSARELVPYESVLGSRAYGKYLDHGALHS